MAPAADAIHSASTYKDRRLCPEPVPMQTHNI